MDIAGEYRLAPKRQAVWEALHDPEVLRRCIPGCEELEQLDSDRYRAKVKMSIGPVKATFNTKLSITEANPPESYRLEGEGQGGAVGFGRGYARVELAESGEGTRLSYTADFQVGGRLAQLGSRLVVSATRKIADDFFSRLASDIDTGAQRIETCPDAPVPSRHRVWILGVAIAAALVILWWWTQS